MTVDELLGIRYVPGLPDLVNWPALSGLLIVLVPAILWGEAAIARKWWAVLLITSPGMGALALVLLLLAGACTWLLATLICTEGRW